MRRSVWLVLDALMTVVCAGGALGSHDLVLRVLFIGAGGFLLSETIGGVKEVFFKG